MGKTFEISSVSPSSIRSDEGLTLETPAFESFYGVQFTLSTHLIKPNYKARLGSTLGKPIEEYHAVYFNQRRGGF